MLIILGIFKKNNFFYIFNIKIKQTGGIKYDIYFFIDQAFFDLAGKEN